ncbi:MAG: carbonic anhydrase [Bacteroidetes bacterium]|nr:MAG: carbonic anhydrase [Bacteroidota bacterium]
MKNVKWFSMFFFAAFMACNTPDNKSSEHAQVAKDSAARDTASQTTHVVADNLVKSEAPDAETKEDQGYALPAKVGGHAQSPVNLVSLKAEKDQSPAVSMKFTTGIDAAENLGHTIQVDFKAGSTSILRGKSFTPKQFHFHTPSEHLVDGITFPMEMHIVNMANDTAQNASPRIMVIGILFKMGQENKFLQEFLKDVPDEEGHKNAIQPGAVRLEDLLSQIPPKDQNAYFTYKGSLTTAPFSENVDWVVLKHVLEASPEQIAAIQKLEGNNARHVHELFDRKLYVH